MSLVVDRFIATALTTNDPLNYIKPLLNFCHWHCRPKPKAAAMAPGHEKPLNLSKHNV
jgi:hypothetical protein